MPKTLPIEQHPIGNGPRQRLRFQETVEQGDPFLRRSLRHRVGDGSHQRIGRGYHALDQRLHASVDAPAGPRHDLPARSVDKLRPDVGTVGARRPQRGHRKRDRALAPHKPGRRLKSRGAIRKPHALLGGGAIRWFGGAPDRGPARAIARQRRRVLRRELVVSSRQGRAHPAVRVRAAAARDRFRAARSAAHARRASPAHRPSRPGHARDRGPPVCRARGYRRGTW